MRNILSKIAFVAGFGLALAFTLGCSSDDGGDNTASDTFTDSRDGKSYKWVKIGEQTWMAENLNYAPQRSDCDEFGNDCVTYDEGSVCYDNQESKCAEYGRLYDWAAANAACPSGWHLPSDLEWGNLVDYANEGKTSGPDCPALGKRIAASGSGWDDCPVAGWHLKAESGWSYYDGNGFSGNGLDTYGFSALPGGRLELDSDGESFYSAGYGGYWWSATPASVWVMYYDSHEVYQRDNEYYGLSIRCVKN
jgi:uncharacterized protein (TIGR02145 family)